MTAIGRVAAESTPRRPARPRPPADAPNILMVLSDDVDTSDIGCSGGDAAIPTMDRLADTGLTRMAMGRRRWSRPKRTTRRHRQEAPVVVGS